jgi:hypothetical protein
MMRRKNTFRLIVASLFLATNSFSQTILMGDPGVARLTVTHLELED